MGKPRSLFHLFSVVSNKQYNFYNKFMWCPSGVGCLDLNPRPVKHESSPITTRPGLPPYSKVCLWQCRRNLKGAKMSYSTVCLWHWLLSNYCDTTSCRVLIQFGAIKTRFEARRRNRVFSLTTVACAWLLYNNLFRDPNSSFTTTTTALDHYYKTIFAGIELP